MDIDQTILGDDCTLAYGLRVASDLEHAGRLSETEGVYEALAKRFPESWEVRTRYARLSWNQQERQKAFSLVREALGLAPDEANVHLEICEYLFVSGERKEAEHHLSEALRLNPDDADLHLKAALTSLENDNKEAAKSASLRALELEPGNKGARQILGDIAWQIGRFQEAADYLLPARVKGDFEKDPNAALASSLYALGRTPDIRELPAPKSHGQHFIESILRATFNWQHGNLDNAASLLAKAEPLAAREPNAPRLQNFYEVMLILKGLLLDFNKNADLYNKTPKGSLFLVGDNNTLPASHLVAPFKDRLCQVRGILIPAFKLSRVTSADEDSQKAHFHAVLDRLPSGAQVMLSAGAQDLRYNANLFHQWRSNPSTNLETAVCDLAAEFLEQSARTCRDRGFEPSYLIPPAPKLKQRKMISTERDEFFAMNRNFRAALREQASALGHPCLDLETAVVEWTFETETDPYLEGSHCHPEVYLTAFNALAAA